MNITELRYLVAIMKWGSVSAAAKQLYAAQPNVSKALKNLEEEYGLRIFERSSTGMIPTEQGKRFIRQAQRVLQQVDELAQEAHQQRSCAELRAHIRESGAIEALDFVLRQGYHMALLRYAAEDEDYYLRYCQRHGLRQEPIMEFSYLLLTSQDSPLARRQVRELDELNDYIEVLHGDTHLPGEESTVSRWEVNPNRRIHVYERCSQFSILQNLPTAYMWSSPMPQRALEQYHLALHNCPAQKQQMRDVLVYPEREPLQPEEQLFVQLLHKQADATIKDSGWKKI